MQRTTLLFWSVLLPVGLILSLFVMSTPAQTTDTPLTDTASPFAVTAAEKEQLLEKAEQALLWFRSMGLQAQRNASPSTYRRMISPIELMQAAAVTKQEGMNDLSRMLLAMLPFFHVTPAECFEIEERLGEDVLTAFQEERLGLPPGGTVDAVTRIREGAAAFLTDSLRPAEKFALYKEPTTAAEIMKVVDTLSSSGRPMLVRYYLRRFLTLPIEPKEYAEIADRIGSQRLLDIATEPHFAPQGEEAVAKIYAEAKKHWQDPDTISRLFGSDRSDKGLLSGESVRGFRRGDRGSIELLVKQLGKTESPREVDEILALILSMGGDAREALSESFRSDNPILVSNAARGLAAVISSEETFLFYSLLFSPSSLISDELRENIEKTIARKNGRKPTRDEAVAVLFARAQDYHQRNRPIISDEQGFVRFWNWNDTNNTLETLYVSVPDAYRLFAFRYAVAADSIAVADTRERSSIRRLYLTAGLENEVRRNGLDSPFNFQDSVFADIVSQASLEQLETILSDAVENEHDGVAMVIATLLATRYDAETLLRSESGQPRALVRAVAAPSRRVRFAALEAIMSLKPIRPYAGSSLVTEALAWFSKADGRNILVSAHPKQSVATKTAGHFIASGYWADIATTSREAMQRVADSPDVEILVIDSVCREPHIMNLVQQLRNDCRTHEVPIAILTNDPNTLDAAVSQAWLVPKTSMQKIDLLQPDNVFAHSIALVYPHILSDEAAQWIHADLFAKTGAEPVPPAIRSQQARMSLRWLTEIVQSVETGRGRKIYHVDDVDSIAAHALRSDIRFEEGMNLAAVIRSNVMQSAMFAVAASNVHSIEQRRQAAESFQKSVEAYGILLRGSQVQNLYDRYNDSEMESAEVQEILGSILDLVETKVARGSQGLHPLTGD